VATQSGSTALVLSKQRGQTPIVGISDDEAVVRRMNLYWGVTPLLAPRLENQQLLDYVTQWTKAEKLVTAGDRVVFIASVHWTGTGHNTILVHQVR